MKLYETEKIRNVALLSHGGAGKKLFSISQGLPTGWDELRKEQR